MLMSEEGNEVPLIQLVNILLREWRLLIALPVMLAAAVGIVTLTEPRAYVATATFIPQTGDSRLSAGASGLARQFGVELGTERPGQSPQFYADLLRTRALLQEMANSTYLIGNDASEPWHGTLAEHYSGAGQDQHGSSNQTVRRVGKALSTTVNRETGAIQVTFKANHPELAEQVVERALDLLNEYNLELRQNRAEQERGFLGDRVGDAAERLMQAEKQIQEFLRRNREFRNSPELLFEHDRLQRQVAMRQEVYTSLLRLFEQAGIDAVRDLPVLTVIDTPTGTAEAEGRGTLLKTAVTLLFGLMLASFIVFARHAALQATTSGSTHYAEFSRLFRQACHDLVRPRHWIRRS